MPNVWTHIVFAEKLLHSFPSHSFDPKAQAYYRFGSQGPDPFFYHSFLPWQKSSVSTIGLAIHYNNCGPFLLDMIKKGRFMKHEETKAYILGFITHHLLDRQTHPYIIYRSGEEGYKHQLLETTIDTIMVKRERNLDTWTSPAYKQIDLGAELHEEVEELLAGLISTHHPTKESLPTHYIKESYKDMKKAFKLFHDPMGLKNKLLFGYITPFSYREKFPEQDYLNVNKTPWLHPTNNQESSTKSFIELYEEALEVGKEVFKRVFLYWETENEEHLEELKEIIGNVSYDTGKDASIREELKYFEPIV
ncbi:zinc dependent phospholipase C family protein [Bacillus coahuilensis]|uniref:zinc dependent phospholipase C family protein n=1 Tax=Bacillus coahuilensis TaxID=408580 RepID=UPI00018509AA|nr:zinc dependent phospholipase C family protein [Bacillus coahuilensis]